MMGHSPAEIAEAWDEVKKSKEHEFMQQDDPEFTEVMQRQLEKMLSLPPPQPPAHTLSIEVPPVPPSPSQPSMNAPRPHQPHQIPLQITQNQNQIRRTKKTAPTIPSMNAPMISVNINGQPQPQGQYIPPAGAVPIIVQDTAMAPQPPPAMPQYHPQSMPVQQQQSPQQRIQYAAAVPVPVQFAQPPPMATAMSMPMPMTMTMAHPNSSIQYTQPHITTLSSISVPFDKADTTLSDISTSALYTDLAVPSNNNSRRGHYRPTSVHSEATSARERGGSFADSDFGIESVAQSVVVSEISYKEKKNRIDWNHPHILYLKDLGYSKTQIQQAYFRLKNNEEHPDSKHRQKLRADDDKFLAYMINILVDELQLVPEHEQRQFGGNSECIDKLYQNWICCICCRVCTKIRDDNACCSCCCSFEYERIRS